MMSVNPGFGGQSFIPHTLNKIKEVRALLNKWDRSKDCRLAVDGGVNQENIQAIAAAGADTFVAGSAIFHGGDYVAAIKALRDGLL